MKSAIFTFHDISDAGGVLSYSPASRFLEISGFDVKRFPYPLVEDIDLGYRLLERGGRIVLLTAFHGKRLKEWRLLNLLPTEIFRRAIRHDSVVVHRLCARFDSSVVLYLQSRFFWLGMGEPPCEPTSRHSSVPDIQSAR